MLQSKSIYCGDNKTKLPDLPSESVDLVYIDPPFNSGATYEIFWKSPEELPSFEDRFGDVKKYIGWLEPRVANLVRVLKPTGSFFFHCDPHANYAIRALLQDEMQLTFRSEIVWKRTSGHSGARRPGPIHDTIFFFTKSDEYTWNPQYQAYDEEYIETFFDHTDEDGRRWKRTDLTGAGIRHGETGNEWRGIDVTAKKRHWALPPSELDKLDAAGRLHWPKKLDGMPRLKQYVEDMPGVPLQDIWDDIRALHNRAIERVGYPTQKPVALLERIVKMASNKGDLVLDAFCGCGTALVAAEKLKRDWIGIDQSPTACRVMAKRLWRDCRLRDNLDFCIRDVLKDEEALRAMHPSDFENWAVIAVGGLPNQAKVGDKGIDGRIFDLIGKTVPEMVQKELVFAFEKQRELEFIPVQVKQKDKAGRQDIDAFETAMRRVGKTFGIIIAFDFTKDAKEEIRRVKKADGVTILAMTVKEILEKQAA